MTVLTLDSFAAAKCLPLDFLTDCGVKEGEYNGKPGLWFTYRNLDTTLAGAQRWRGPTGQNGKTVWRWGGENSKAIVPFNLEFCGARPDEDGTLYITEGESDCLTLWFHRYPAIGIPGAMMIHCLQAEHIANATRIIITRDNDDGAGAAFVGALAARLRDLNFTGAVLYAAMPAPHKDVSDLHIALDGDTEKFTAIFSAIVAQPPPIALDNDDRSALRKRVAELLAMLDGGASPDQIAEAFNAAQMFVATKIPAQTQTEFNITITDRPGAPFVFADMPGDFQNTFLRQRTNVPDDNESRDLALMVVALKLDFTAQQVVDTAIESRNTAKIEARDAAYYNRLLATAHAEIAASNAVDAIPTLLQAKVTPATQTAARNALAAIFALPITAIYRLKLDDPPFEIDTPDGRIRIGTIDEISNQARFRRRLALHTKTLLSPREGPEWDRIYTLIIRAAELTDMGDDATGAGEIAALLREYLAGNTLYKSKADATIAQHAVAWLEPEGIAVHKSSRQRSHVHGLTIVVSEFTRWLAMRRLTFGTAEIAKRFRMLGGVPHREWLKDSAVSSWTFPAEVAKQLGVVKGETANEY